jgi:hypothetical protein
MVDSLYHTTSTLLKHKSTNTVLSVARLNRLIFSTGIVQESQGGKASAGSVRPSTIALRIKHV